MEVRSSIVSFVIETLATSEQVDASTLTGLVRVAYIISRDLSEDGRKAVSLIVLKSLFRQADEAVVDADGGQNGKISFDLSESCENFLEQILHELKDEILESSHPLLTSLKERSNLVIPNASESVSPMENIQVINLIDNGVHSNASDDETLNKEINSMEHDDRIGGGIDFLIDVCIKCNISN